jgi:hypothetical protein
VGVVARARRHRRTAADRLSLAVSLLADPVFDTFLTGASPFAELPEVVQNLANGKLEALCHVIEYPNAEESSSPDPKDRT